MGWKVEGKMLSTALLSLFRSLIRRASLRSSASMLFKLVHVRLWLSTVWKLMLSERWRRLPEPKVTSRGRSGWRETAPAGSHMWNNVQRVTTQLRNTGAKSLITSFSKYNDFNNGMSVVTKSKVHLIILSKHVFFFLQLTTQQCAWTICCELEEHRAIIYKILISACFRRIKTSHGAKASACATRLLALIWIF